MDNREETVGRGEETEESGVKRGRREGIKERGERRERDIRDMREEREGKEERKRHEERKVSEERRDWRKIESE